MQYKALKYKDKCSAQMHNATLSYLVVNTIFRPTNRSKTKHIGNESIKINQIIISFRTIHLSKEQNDNEKNEVTGYAKQVIQKKN